MSKKDFKFWLTFIILMALSCEGAFYYKHHIIVKRRAVAEKIAEARTAAQIAAGPVISMKTVRQDFPIALSAKATINISDSADIKPEIAGKIASVEFLKGEDVETDDLLFKIDPAVPTKSEEQTDVTAPIDGVITYDNLKIGDEVLAGQKIATVEARDPMKIEFSLPEANFNKIDEGQEVTFVVAALPDVFFKGEIYEVDDAVKPDTHTFGIKAMASNAEGKLTNGMKADLKLVTDIHQNAMVIPESAIVTNGNDHIVYVISDAVAKATPVTLGIHQDNQVEILTGLMPDQDIIIEGTDRIHDGAPLTLDEDTEEKPTEKTADTPTAD